MDEKFIKLIESYKLTMIFKPLSTLGLSIISLYTDSKDLVYCEISYGIDTKIKSITKWLKNNKSK